MATKDYQAASSMLAALRAVDDALAACRAYEDDMRRRAGSAGVFLEEIAQLEKARAALAKIAALEEQIEEHAA